MFTDDFTGYSGNLEANGWTKAGSGPVCVIASATPLTYTGYSSGGGNYVSLPTASSTTSRIYKGFTSTTAIDNTFYVSFLLRLSSATATGDYFISLGDPTTGTAYSPRLFAKSSGAGFVLGVSKNSATGTYGSTVYSFNTTYLVVMRLSGVTGTSNDTAYVWVNPGLSSEPATASAECSDTTGSDAAFTGGNVGNFHWHNRSANNAGGAFDGVRVSAASTSATAWSDLAIRPTINAVTLSSSLSVHMVQLRGVSVLRLRAMALLATSRRRLRPVMRFPRFKVPATEARFPSQAAQRCGFAMQLQSLRELPMEPQQSCCLVVGPPAQPM